MKIAGEGKLLRIFIGESDRHRGRALYEVIVRTARELGLAGATGWRGSQGYWGASRDPHADKLRRSDQRVEPNAAGGAVAFRAWAHGAGDRLARLYFSAQVASDTGRFLHGESADLRLRVQELRARRWRW